MKSRVHEEDEESNDEEDEGEEETEEDEESSGVEDITMLYTPKRISKRNKKQTDRYQPSVTTSNRKTKSDSKEEGKPKKVKSRFSRKPSGKKDVKRIYSLKTEKAADEGTMSTRNRIHNVLCYPLVYPLIAVFRLNFYCEITTIIQGVIPGTTRNEIVDALDPTGRLYRRFQYCAYYQYLNTHPKMTQD